MRIVFAGTPDIAETVLKKLLTTEHEIVAVYTQPDRPAGRGRKLTPSPVKVLAEQHNIPVKQPLSLKNEAAQAELAELAPDLMIVVAYGLILPQAILDIPAYGCWNVHVSLLPRWRGAAPIQRAIEAGDAQTGVTIMQMDAGLDTGDALLTKACRILPKDTAATLHDKLAELGADALLETLALFEKKALIATPQPLEGVTYAQKMSKEEAQLNWEDDALTLHNRVRAFNPWPVTFTYLGQDRLRVWQSEIVSPYEQIAPAGHIIQANEQGIDVACGQGVLRLTVLQLPGGKAQPVKQLLNAYRERFAPGTVLGA